MLSSRFRFAESVKDEFPESECDGGLRTPLIEAITRLAIPRGMDFDVYFAIQRDSRPQRVAREMYDRRESLRVEYSLNVCPNTIYLLASSVLSR